MGQLMGDVVDVRCDPFALTGDQRVIFCGFFFCALFFCWVEL